MIEISKCFIVLHVNIGDACGGFCCFSTCIGKELGPLEKCSFCEQGLMCYGDLNVVSMKKGVCGWRMQGTTHFYNFYKQSLAFNFDI